METLYLNVVKDAAGTRLTGLEYHAGNMYHQCREGPAQGAREALASFNVWLLALPRRLLALPRRLFVAHNAPLDARVLVCKYVEEQLLFPANTAFADSIRLFRHIYPGRKSYSLTSLFEDIERKPFNAHVLFPQGPLC